MEKSFWLAIRANKYAFPAGQDLSALTDELFSFIPNSDPEWRDSIGYEIFANWIETEPYSPEALRGYLARLLANLRIGLSESGTDSVFGRAFSALFLAEVIHRDNQKPYLESFEVKDALERVLAYLAAERDLRGFVDGKGWAHALAHTADLLMVLARSRHLDSESLGKILDAIAEKMKKPTEWIFIHGEDDRLTRAITTIFERDLVPLEQVGNWMAQLRTGWVSTWQDEFRAHAFFNTRNLLRAMLVRVTSMQELPHQAEYQSALLDAIAAHRPN